MFVKLLTCSKTYSELYCHGVGYRGTCLGGLAVVLMFSEVHVLWDHQLGVVTFCCVNLKGSIRNNNLSRRMYMWGRVVVAPLEWNKTKRLSILNLLESSANIWFGRVSRIQFFSIFNNHFFNGVQHKFLLFLLVSKIKYRTNVIGAQTLNSNYVDYVIYIP